MQYKPGNWVTGFKRSPRAANVQNRDMGLFLNSTGKFEPIDDSWDNLHSGGLFISDDNKLYFRDETNKDIYINSPVDNALALYASVGVGINTTPDRALHVKSASNSPIKTESTDAITGIKFHDPDANANLYYVGSTDHFYFTSSSKLGIGSEAPTSLLTVGGNSATTLKPTVAIVDTTAGASLTLRGQSPVIFFDITSSGQGTILTDGQGLAIKDGTLDAQGTTDFIIDSSGNVGIGATAGTLLELNGTAPYLTIKNSTHEDGDGGRESKIIFEGEQSGGEITTLAQIQASHDGTSDDEKGDLIFSTNDGSDGASPTERMRIDSAGNVGIGTDAPSSPLQISYTGGDLDSGLRLVSTASDNFNWITEGTNANLAANESLVHMFGQALSSNNAGYIGFKFSSAGSASNQVNIGLFDAGNLLSVAAGGDVTVSTGNLVIGTAGKGIDFSAQTATATGTTTGELLDHYEEGTFTIAFTAGSGSVTVNTSYDTGTYTRIGRTVHFSALGLVGSVSTPSGGLNMTGLPFASHSGTEASDYSAFSLWVYNLSGDINTAMAYISPSQTQLGIQGFDGTTTTTIADKIQATSQIIVTGTYTV